MGEHEVHKNASKQQLRAFMQAILSDLRALEVMVEGHLFEGGITRIGAEQEMFLIDGETHAAPTAAELLTHLSDPRFKTELARFNLEFNLDPQPLSGGFLHQLEEELTAGLHKAEEAAATVNTQILLTGILPTLRHEDIGPDMLTPDARYQRIDDSVFQTHPQPVPVFIDGPDQYEGTHDSVALEGANISLQLHWQVEPENAAYCYNLAQLISAPLLAAAVNSPVLFGHRLWQETRIALFERALDTRSGPQLTRGMPSRISFGSAWVQESILEIFQDNAARYPIIMTRKPDPNPLKLLEQGIIPKLSALTLHSGTVWRWNRPCYGILEGKPHLRIENRVLPAGPTLLDEVANAALFYGLMLGLAEEYQDFTSRLPFHEARANFLAAAQQGLDARLTWLDGRVIRARSLLLEELIPKARRGLTQVGVPSEDLERYLGTLNARVRKGQTGARWLLNGLAQNPHQDPTTLLHHAVLAMLHYQQQGVPVHRWAPLVVAGRTEAARLPHTVSDIMVQNLFTVRPDDVIDLASRIMDWKHVRHIPVETEKGKLVGLLTIHELLHAHDILSTQDSPRPIPVAEMMNPEPITIPPDMPILEAMQLMLASDTGSLLVVNRTQLLGIVTEQDLVRAAYQLLTTIS
ncbi:CBS domain containing protein [Nitrosococcus halophilus Nc 4]|uniref:CBS domain containing protein n=1 Tax=Nitrosococcus halophilus (strain Nc4) TaxID=472759 RepID=D5BXE2_NITHN|nr:CBS domain-containing protein [Nitrosococcus halophilus]ADE15825.1 CBS domain containing protein [Nitrosococcus halophilus Nc 4]